MRVSAVPSAGPGEGLGADLWITSIAIFCIASLMGALNFITTTLDLRAKGMLFPSQANILETEVTTATRVAEFMFDQGLAQVKRPRDVRTWIEGQLYRPFYPG